MLRWEDYISPSRGEDAYRACRAICREDFAGMRDVIARLARVVQPGSVACLGAGVLNDIPYAELVAGGATVHLVDWMPGSVDSGIRQSIISFDTGGNPRCAYCVLAEDDAGAYCRGYRPVANDARDVCAEFTPSGEKEPGCTAFHRGTRPHVHCRDATAGYASSFARLIPESIGNVTSWKQALRRAGATVKKARRHRTPLDIADASIDLVTSSMLISQFDREPFTYFARQAATRLGPPTDREERLLQPAQEALRFELFTTQAERHCDEIMRILAPDGCCLVSFELFQYDAGNDAWFLVRETHAALEIMQARFAFDFDILPPEDAIARVKVGPNPSLVHCFVLRQRR